MMVMMSSDWMKYIQDKSLILHLHDSIVVSIPACHAGDRGSIPRRGVSFFLPKTISRFNFRSLIEILER